MTAEPKDIAALRECIMGGTIYKCECGAPVKPDVILFGEGLPGHYVNEVPKIKQADLVFITGTSLKVYPFAYLAEMIGPTTPVVLINFDNPLKKNYERFLFMQGDIDEHFRKLLEDIL